MSRVRAAAALALCFAATACADAMLSAPAQTRQPSLAPVAETSLASALRDGVGPGAGPVPVRITLCRMGSGAPSPGPALVLVDGRRASHDVLARLNPADVVAVTIHKAADAVREYGAEAAGGAVVVTTRLAAR
ncbi:MAG TPA: hypothetical protein VFS20_21880 [Longimicrobium sp.]|nr:hypothetical protein [Longimicrobium sp.]